MTIKDIDNLTYDKAKEMAIEVMKVKGHDCVFIEFEDAFGYSVLVFKNGKNIRFANDYELHHGYMVEKHGKESLREFYIKEMENKLYTDEELLSEIKTYDEYNKKQYFLRNYWIMRYEYVSAFHIGKEQEKKIEDAKKNFPLFNPVSFCYVADMKIIEKQRQYLKHLQDSCSKLKANVDTFREMVRYELNNHEADYTDALRALNLAYDELTVIQQEIVKEELNRAIRRNFVTK